MNVAQLAKEIRETRGLGTTGYMMLGVLEQHCSGSIVLTEQEQLILLRAKTFTVLGDKDFNFETELAFTAFVMAIARRVELAELKEQVARLAEQIPSPRIKVLDDASTQGGLEAQSALG